MKIEKKIPAAHGAHKRSQKCSAAPKKLGRSRSWGSACACRGCSGRRTKAHNNGIADRLVQRRLVAKEVLSTAAATCESLAPLQLHVVACTLLHSLDVQTRAPARATAGYVFACGVKRRYKTGALPQQEPGIAHDLQGQRPLLTCSLRPPQRAPIVLVEAEEIKGLRMHGHGWRSSCPPFKRSELPCKGSLRSGKPTAYQWPCSEVV